MQFKFTGKTDKLTIKVQPPVLTPEDEKRLKEAEQRAPPTDDCLQQAARSSQGPTRREELSYNH